MSEEEQMEFEKIIVCCPLCHRKLMSVDRRSTIDKIAQCRRCKKMIVYRTSTHETEIKPLPTRKCASGMTFI